MWPFKSKREEASDQNSLEEKLKVLAQHGLHLQAPFTIDDLLKHWSRDQYSKRGFEMTLIGLGETEGQPPWRPLCRNVWHFDTECIEDAGSYVRIAARMMEMTDGALALENIRDQVDIEGDVAWLEFEHRGKQFHFDCRVKDDWVDPAVFGPFIDLLESAAPNKMYLYYGLFGQDCILACTSTDQYKALRDAGINFEPLKAEKLR